MLPEFKLAMRRLWRSPWSTVTLVLILALGFGAAAGVETLINRTMSDPYSSAPDSHRLRALWSTERESDLPGAKFVGLGKWSFPTLQTLRRESKVFEDISGYYYWIGANMSLGDSTVRVRPAWAHANLWRLFGVSPAAGRFFDQDEDDVVGEGAVAVLSYAAWQRYFGGRQDDTIGRIIKINGVSVEIVGVAPEGFLGVNVEANPAVWMPITIGKVIGPFVSVFDHPEYSLYTAIGKVREGITPEAASAEVHAIARSVAESHADSEALRYMGGTSTDLSYAFLDRRIRERWLGYRNLLSLVAALILVVACVNVAQLLGVRASDRLGDSALSEAIGATRWQVIKTNLVEYATVFFVAGLASVPVGNAILRSLWSFRPPSMAEGVLSLSIGFEAYKAGLRYAILATLLVSIFPLVRVAGYNLATQLRRSAGTTKRSRSLGAALLVVLQIGIASFALAGAAQAWLGYQSVRGMDVGFDHDQLAVLTAPAGDSGYEPSRVRVWMDDALRTVEALPEVEAAAAAENRLLRGAFFSQPIVKSGETEQFDYTTPDASSGTKFEVHRTSAVTANFFGTTGIEVIEGRAFSTSDREGTEPVAVINETMARAMWQDPAEALDKTFHFRSADQPAVRVVGVTADHCVRRVCDSNQFYIWLPISQHPKSTVTLHVRTTDDPSAALPAIQDALRALDPRVPLNDVAPLSHFVAEGQWLDRTTAMLLLVATCVAALLSLIGVLAAVSQQAQNRRREIAIRMAYGGTHKTVGQRLLRPWILLSLAGSVAGVTTWILWLESAMASKMEAGAPLGHFAVVVVLLVVACVALFAAIPIMKAIAAEPVVALRGE